MLSYKIGYPELRYVMFGEGPTISSDCHKRSALFDNHRDECSSDVYTSESLGLSLVSDSFIAVEEALQPTNLVPESI